MGWALEGLRWALDFWSGTFAMIINYLLYGSVPDTGAAAGFYRLMERINSALVPVGIALLVIFFLVGVVTKFNSFQEVRRPEAMFELLVRFVLAQLLVTNGLELLRTIFSVVRGVMASVIKAFARNIGGTNIFILPPELVASVENLSWYENIGILFISLIALIVIVVNCAIMLVTVYGRLFKLLIYWAVSPIPFAAFASQQTSEIGKTFIKSFAGACLSGVIILLSCIIFTVFAKNPVLPDGSDFIKLLSYIALVLVQMIALLSVIKIADNLVKEMTSL